MSDLESILSSATEVLRPLLTRVYEAGLERGRHEGAEALRAKLSDILQSDPSDPVQQSAPERKTPFEVRKGVPVVPSRAAPGSVKPFILDLIEKRPGLSANEIGDIAERSGIKPNSVRGTLWTLGNEGSIEKRDGKWYPPSQKDEAADDSQTERSAAQTEQAEGVFS